MSVFKCGHSSETALIRVKNDNMMQIGQSKTVLQVSLLHSTPLAIMFFSRLEKTCLMDRFGLFVRKAFEESTSTCLVSLSDRDSRAPISGVQDSSPTGVNDLTEKNY